MTNIYNYIQDFFALFFPDLCAACGKNLFKHEQVFCTNCIFHLPYTNHHQDPKNRVARQFWGRFPFVQAGAYVYFQKGNKVQNLMHQLKYNNRPECGYRMGELYAYTLKRSVDWVMPDAILPVPLHPDKKKKRSYNQSEFIARGMASILKIPVISDNLLRAANTETQTRKSRFDRYQNLQNAFLIREPKTLNSKHLLLVDDVITTGATLEACSIELLKLTNVRISIASLAFAD